MQRLALLLVATGLWGTCGCAMWSQFGTDDTGLEYGKTWYVGGAGPLGNAIGTFDVPKGLRKARYKGAIEVFGWQTTTLRDQVDRSRNEEQASRLARRIQDYLDTYPGRRVNLIALSAGTGIVTWALEALPENYHIGTVVFMGSSVSRRYDLSLALSHIDGRLYCFHSTRDKLLRVAVPLTGSVDRQEGSPSVAGVYGFALPPMPDEALLRIYRERLRNKPYKNTYNRYGYSGAHTDSTSPRFIEKVIAPLLEEPLQPSAPSVPPARPPAASRS